METLRKQTHEPVEKNYTMTEDELAKFFDLFMSYLKSVLKGLSILMESYGNIPILKERL